MLMKIRGKREKKISLGPEPNGKQTSKAERPTPNAEFAAVRSSVFDVWRSAFDVRGLLKPNKD
jgi:hypothetical protein